MTYPVESQVAPSGTGPVGRRKHPLLTPSPTPKPPSSLATSGLANSETYPVESQVVPSGTGPVGRRKHPLITPSPTPKPKATPKPKVTPKP